MPIVTIKLIEGRDVEVKRGLVKDVTDAICKNVGCPPDAVSIDLIEYSNENLAKGGKLFVDGR